MLSATEFSVLFSLRSYTFVTYARIKQLRHQKNMLDAAMPFTHEVHSVERILKA